MNKWPYLIIVSIVALTAIIVLLPPTGTSQNTGGMATGNCAGTCRWKCDTGEISTAGCGAKNCCLPAPKTQTQKSCPGECKWRCGDGLQYYGKRGELCSAGKVCCVPDITPHLKDTSCTDGKQDSGETGVDCGGLHCSPCPICGDHFCDTAETCSTCPTDCGACRPSHCTNGIKDADETDVDCGASCSNTCNSLTTSSGSLKTLSSNPRYFTSDGSNAVLLGGFYSGYEFTTNGWDAGGDNINFDSYLNFLKTNGLNHVRLWIVESTKGDTSKPLATPLAYQRSSTCCAKDGGNKFDLDKPNPDFYNRLRDYVSKANQMGIYVSIILFDKWTSENTKVTTLLAGNPYAKDNNVNGIDADPNGAASGTELRQLTNTAVVEKQKAYIRKVIDTVNDLDNVLYEVANEETPDSKAWQYALVDYVHQYESTKPKQHPVGISTFHSGTADLLASHADYISPEGNPRNNIANPYLSELPPTDPSKVTLLDTDHNGDTILLDAVVARAWIWKAITRGYNLVVLGLPTTGALQGGSYTTGALGLVQNIGQSLQYVSKMNLATMIPSTTLCSTQYCLASSNEYLIYFPSGGSATVNLAATPGLVNVEWLNPGTHAMSAGNPVTGGGTVSLTPPGPGDWVVYLSKQGTSRRKLCTTGQIQSCLTLDNCPGSQSCTNDNWGSCIKNGTSCNAVTANNCGNGIQDGGEQGIDCGGPCPFCTNDLDAWKCKDKLSGQAASASATWSMAGPIIPTKDDSDLNLKAQITSLEPLKYYKKLTVNFDLHIAQVKLRINEGGHQYDGIFTLTRPGSGNNVKYSGYWQVLIKDGTQTSIYWAGEHGVPQAALPTPWKNNMDYHVTAVFDAQQDTLSLTFTDKKTNQVVSDLTFPSVYPISSDIADTGNGLFLTFAQNADWRYSNIRVDLEPGGPYWGGVRTKC